jgi:hypothetical protein
MEPTNSEPFEVEVVDGVVVAKPRSKKKLGRSTGSPRGCALFAILICLALLGAAWWSMQPTESVCVVESRGVSGNREGVATSEVGFKLRLGNDRFWQSRVWQSHLSWAEAETAIAGYLPQETYPCWYNRLFPTYITLSPDQPPATFLFWGIMAALSFVSGCGLASLLAPGQRPRNLSGRRLPHRLAEEGGGIGPVLWFMALLLPFGIGVIYALVQLFRALWPLSGDDPYFFRIVTLVCLGLALAGLLGLLYWIGKYLYRLFIHSWTELEIEALPLKPGQRVRLYVRHQAGRLPTESLRLGLVSFEMTDQQHRNPNAKANRTTNPQLHRRDHIFIGGQDHLAQRPKQVWEGDFFLNVPATAKPSVDLGFPQIKWEIRLQLKIAKGPDYEVNFPVTIVEAE